MDPAAHHHRNPICAEAQQVLIRLPEVGRHAGVGSVTKRSERAIGKLGANEALPD
jgi:hypothetical protein